MTRRPALSAHIGYLFADLPLEQRLAAAKDAGFDAVEHPAPFDIPARDMAKALQHHELTMTQISSGMGQPGEKGLASLRGREKEFRDGFKAAVDYAETIGCPFVHPMAGTGADASVYHDNIAFAVDHCRGRKVSVLVEAINSNTVTGYFMDTLTKLLALAGAMTDLRILVDTFHMRMIGIDPAEAIRLASGHIGHVHIADHPGRSQPGTGTIDFSAVLKALDDTNYRGAVGFEYVPTGPEHLGWMQSFATAPNSTHC